MFLIDQNKAKQGKAIRTKPGMKIYSIDKKSRIRETKNLSTDADRRTDTILEKLRDLSF